MSVSRDIAQARTYSSAYSVLCIQILAVAIMLGAYAPHWWWAISVPFVVVFMSMNRWSRAFVLIALSSFWGFLFQQISVESGAGLWSYLVAGFAFLVAYGINATGMVGLDHSIPDLSS